MLDPSCRGSPIAIPSDYRQSIKKANRRNEKRIYLQSARHARQNGPAPGPLNKIRSSVGMRPIALSGLIHAKISEIAQ